MVKTDSNRVQSYYTPRETISGLKRDFVLANYYKTSLGFWRKKQQ